MKTSVTIGQIPTSWDIGKNLAMIDQVLTESGPDDVVLAPEGALSGYDSDLSPLATLDPAMLAHAVETVSELARRRAVHLFCGSLILENGRWWNAALYFSPSGDRWSYRKINLAMSERAVLGAGSDLPALTVRQPRGGFTAGVQLCREIRFPEQWQHLARSGAAAFVYLTNAANGTEPSGPGLRPAAPLVRRPPRPALSDGGDTALGNAVLLCGHHHRVIHANGRSGSPRTAWPSSCRRPGSIRNGCRGATSTTRAADRELPGGGRRISRAEMRGRRRRRGVVWTAARIAAPFSATGHSRHRD